MNDTVRGRIEEYIAKGQIVWRHDAMLDHSYHVWDCAYSENMAAAIRAFGNAGTIFANDNLDEFMKVLNKQPDAQEYTISPDFDGE